MMKQIMPLLLIVVLAPALTWGALPDFIDDPAVPKEGPAYVIGPSDEVEISVLGYPELTTKTAVLPDGHISFPFLGRVKAEGQNVQELTQYLQKALDPFVFNPQVTIIVQQIRSKRFSVLGEVKRPGMFPLSDANMTIYEAIAQAEGFLPTAYPKQVHVLRNDGTGKQMVIDVDLGQAVAVRSQEMPLTLLPGDVVFVPGQSDSSKRFSVLGDVRKPGVFPLEDMDMTVLEAVAKAEGFLATAYKQQVSVVRNDSYGNRTSVNIDLADPAAAKTEAAGIKLRPGDVVYVPGQTDRKQVCVIGKVMVPGRYSFSPGMTVVDVLSSAGWVSPEGVASSVMLVRQKGKDKEFLRINAYQAVAKNGAGQDLALEPGDIIYVPESFISKVSSFAGFFSSSIEPFARTYLRVYDAANPASYVVER